MYHYLLDIKTTYNIPTINHDTYKNTQTEAHTHGHKPRITTVTLCTLGHPGARQSTCHTGLYAAHRQCCK